MCSDSTPMTEKTLWDVLDGLHAYDDGAPDSGIHDERLRARCVSHLNAMSEDERRLMISRFLREYYLSDEALAQGYGWEDVHDFIDWYMDLN